MRDDWLIHRLISILVKRLKFTSRDNLTGEVNNFIKKYGCDTFVKDFNKKLAEWLKSEKNAVNCEWDVICQFIRPKRFNIEIGTIEISIEDSWLIQRLIKELTKYTEFESGADRTRNVNGYIKKYGCEQFVKHFNERLKEWILKNMESFDWSLFTTFVRPQSWSYDLKKESALMMKLLACI
ncbi:unnamed protein product [Mytilus edulis]|uniref:Uncharacterized protein n=1 Tax=Mytilus edulis TaxID=6550 RepID=A0A8S3QE37_MYTED|nr:unnamed protein product [Mytilus edulis]